MKKITFVVLHLGYGGIEKAVSSLANLLCEDYQIEIISTYNLYEKPAFFIDPKVKITYLKMLNPNKKEFLYYLKNFKPIKLFKEGLKSIEILYLKRKKMIDAIKQIDSEVIISTIPFHNYLVGKYAKKGTYKIAWEHSHHNNRKKYIKKMIRSCQNIDCLVSVSKDLNFFYSNKLRNKNIKCKHISLSLDYFPEDLSTLSKKEITAIGRLSKEKGMLDLIDVFKIVNSYHSDWHLNVVGDGLEKTQIEGKIIQSNLKNEVTLHGFKNREGVNKILSNTSVYVMTSFTESFGLVLIEAMSYGIPCVAFDSAQGAKEIITNKENGFLVTNRDKQEMANVIIKLIEEKELRTRVGARAREKALTFTEDNIKEIWVKLLEEKK